MILIRPAEPNHCRVLPDPIVLQQGTDALIKEEKLLYVPCVSSLAALSVNIKVSNIKMSMVVSLPIVLAATSAQEGERENVKQTKMPPLSSAICNALGS